MDAPVQVSTTAGGGRSRSAPVLADCPWEGGQAPDATPSQL
jgi:hypothetical protein